ncbi:MAG: L,D-transpeptidase family protein [Acetivibrionales bacterium]
MPRKAIVVFAVLILSFLTVKLVSHIRENPYSSIKQPEKTEYLQQNGLKEDGCRTHVHITKPDIPLSEIIKSKGIKEPKEINLHVDLKTRTMFFRYRDIVLKEYRISAGKNTDKGDKEKEGDYRTPRGEFYICTKVKYSPSREYLGSRWMLLSYPNREHAERGLISNLISKADYERIIKSISMKAIPPQDTILGNAIGIHGGAKPDYPRDWTAGCIGMYDEDIEEVFEYVNEGTTVVIE